LTITNGSPSGYHNSNCSTRTYLQTQIQRRMAAMVSMAW
jgi:hypothetical protein